MWKIRSPQDSPKDGQRSMVSFKPSKKWLIQYFTDLRFGSLILSLRGRSGVVEGCLPERKSLLQNHTNFAGDLTLSQ